MGFGGAESDLPGGDAYSTSRARAGSQDGWLMRAPPREPSWVCGHELVIGWQCADRPWGIHPSARIHPGDLIRIKWRAPGLSFNGAMPTIRQPLPPEDARREELARALRRLEAGIAPQQVMDEMTRRLAAKLLHAHTLALEAELL